MARGIVADRRAKPLPADEDATSALLAARVDGEPLPDEMIVGTIRQVLVVGIIAPSVMIGSIAVHLGRDRALQSQLRADPSLVPAAVEEFLRLYTPYRGFARTRAERRHHPRPDDPRGRADRARSTPRPTATRTSFPIPTSSSIDRPNMQRFARLRSRAAHVRRRGARPAAS